VRPKLGRRTEDLDRLLARNADAPARPRLTLIRIFEELRALGYGSGYDTIRRYARRWSKAHPLECDGERLRPPDLRARARPNLKAVWEITAAIVAIYTVKWLATYGPRVVLSQVANSIVANIQKCIFDQMLRMKVSYYIRSHSSEFIARPTFMAQSASSVLNLLIATFARDALTSACLHGGDSGSPACAFRSSRTPPDGLLDGERT
jgi:hypothetical protein